MITQLLSVKIGPKSRYDPEAARRAAKAERHRGRKRIRVTVGQTQKERWTCVKKRYKLPIDEAVAAMLLDR